MLSSSGRMNFRVHFDSNTYTSFDPFGLPRTKVIRPR
jgi:hypothetical protein